MKPGVIVALSAIGSILTFIGCLWIVRCNRVEFQRLETERYNQGVRMGWYLHVHRTQLKTDTIRLYGLDDVMLQDKNTRRT